MASGKRERRHRVADVLLREREGLALADCVCGEHFDFGDADALSRAFNEHVGPRPGRQEGRAWGVVYTPGEKIA